MNEKTGPEADDAGPFASLDFWGESLDPDPIVALIPLRPYKPTRKGDPLVKKERATGSVPVAKFGTCHFFSYEHVVSRDPSAHLGYVVDAIESRIDAIRTLKDMQRIDWRITFFEGDRPNEKLKDVSPDLIEAIRQLGIPLTAKSLS